MPLRDHFRPPLTRYALWEELHGLWPGIAKGNALGSNQPAGLGLGVVEGVGRRLTAGLWA